MRLYDIIVKKKRGEALSEDEIRDFIKGYTSGELPDYQVSSLLMAICLKGMNAEETAILTDAIAKSGDTVDLSEFGELSADKHSTGGVGDKTTLIVAPIAATLGCKVAKMSGRGLGHTGGTIDKLETFKGYNTALSVEDFLNQVRRIGIAVTGQSGNLAPADKKLYALRDVTATVDSIPLITSSIMGKKLASGSHSIVLDVKYGSGAFAKTPADAEELADNMVRIGKACGRKVCALITDMDTPLGSAIGNALEVKEAIDVLRGKGPSDLVEISVALSAAMAALALGIDYEEAKERARKSISDGTAFKKFKEWISAQGADAKYAEDPELLPKAKYSETLFASTDGYISRVNSEAVGIAAMTLGAGRASKEDVIDHAAGITLLKKTGDSVKAGDAIAVIETNNEQTVVAAMSILSDAITVGKDEVKKNSLIYKILT